MRELVGDLKGVQQVNRLRTTAVREDKPQCLILIAYEAHKIKIAFLNTQNTHKKTEHY